MEIIDSSTASRVRKHISKSVHSHHPQQHKKLEALLGRALGIQNLYRDSHDVLVHAQSSTWRVHSDLVKELMKLRNPEQDLHQFKCLRMPRENTKNGIEEYSKSADAKNKEQLRFVNLKLKHYIYWLYARIDPKGERGPSHS